MSAAVAVPKIEKLFTNPVKLSFHPPTLVEGKQETVDVLSSCRLKHDHNEDWECDRTRVNVPNVSLRRIFADDLMRTLWLAAKCRYLTCQYFHMDVVRAARRIRKNLPVTSYALTSMVNRLTGGGFVGIFADSRSLPFAEQLYPHVLWVLIHENCWPYIVPVTVSPICKLEWEYVPRPNPEWPHEFQWQHYYHSEFLRQAQMQRPEFTTCDVCRKSVLDPIHQLRG